MSNESVESKMNAALGAATSQRAVGDTDWRAKAEELERQLQKERVEGGRLKKTSEELEALRRENEALRAKQREEELIGSLPEEDRSAVPDEVLNVAAKMVKQTEARFDERLRVIESARQREVEENREAARRGIAQKVADYCPTFLDDVSEGSDKYAAWCEYKRYNEASITGAFASGDFDTLKYHIDSFYRMKLGIPVPSGRQDASAAPDPRSNVGGVSQVPAYGSGTVYTEEQFNELYDLKELARDRGDWEEFRRISKEIERAPQEGRVKNA